MKVRLELDIPDSARCSHGCRWDAQCFGSDEEWARLYESAAMTGNKDLQAVMHRMDHQMEMIKELKRRLNKVRDI